jgi:hypothetical protein
MQTNLAKKKRMPILALVMMTVFSAVCCFFVEGHAYFNPTNRVSMTDWEFFISFAVVAAVIFFFFFFVFRRYQIRINWPFLIVAVVLFISEVIAVVFFTGIYDTGQLVFMPTSVQKLRSVISFGVTCVALYSFFVIFPQLDTNRIALILAAFGLVVIAFAALLYSYFTEFDIYRNLFLNGGPENYYSSPQSFATHRNIYARILLYGIFAEAYLQMVAPHRWRWFIQLFLYLNGLMILSKATTFVATIFMLFYSIWLLVRTFKKYRRFNLIVFGTSLVGLLFLFVGQVSGFFEKCLPSLYLFLSSFRDVFLDSISGSFFSRYYDWTDLLREITKNPITVLCGFGEGFTQNVLDLATGLTSSPAASVPLDNAVLFVWSRSGLIGVLLYLAEIVYLIYLAFEGWHRGIEQNYVSFFVLVCFLILGMVENCNAFNFLSDSFPMLILAAYPLLSEHYWLKNPQADNDALSAYLSPKKITLISMKKSLLWVDLAYAVEAPFAALFLGCQRSIDALFGFSRYDSPVVLASFGVFFLLLPLFLGRLVELRNQSRRKSFGALASVVAIATVATGLLPLFFDPLYSLAALSLWLVVFVFLRISGSLWFLPSIRGELGKFLLFLLLTLTPYLGLSYFSEPFSPYLFFVACIYALLVWLLLYAYLPLDHGNTKLYPWWSKIEYGVSCWSAQQQIAFENNNRLGIAQRGPKS